MKMFKNIESVLSGLMVAIIVVLLVDPSECVPSNEDATSSGEWRVITKVLDECANKGETAQCLGIKATAFLQRASRASIIPVFSGLTLIKDINDDSRSGRALSESEIENSLPSDAEERSGRVIDLMMDSVIRFLQTHSLQVKLPAEEIARSLDEGRVKVKKVLLPILLKKGFKYLVIPLVIGTIAIIAFKALFIGKLALLVAGALGFQKFLGAGIFGSLFGAKTIETVAYPSPSYSNNAAYNPNSGYSSGYSSSGSYSSGNSAYPNNGGWNSARTLDSEQQDSTHKLVFRGQTPVQFS